MDSMTTTHPDSEIAELRAHIDSMLEVVSTGRRKIRAHLVWEARQMVNHVKPADLTTAELAALVAVLHAAHARVITPPTGDRPILRIIPKAVGIGSGV
jgi:hypothetical protein